MWTFFAWHDCIWPARLTFRPEFSRSNRLRRAGSTLPSLDYKSPHGRFLSHSDGESELGLPSLGLRTMSVQNLLPPIPATSPRALSTTTSTPTPAATPLPTSIPVPIAAFALPLGTVSSGTTAIAATTPSPKLRPSNGQSHANNGVAKSPRVEPAPSGSGGGLLMRILHHAQATSVFAEHCRQEYNVENYIFYMAACRYEAAPSVASFTQLYDTFLSAAAPMPVNVSSTHMREAHALYHRLLLANSSSAPSASAELDPARLANALSTQKQEIFRLMQSDTLPRFLNSKRHILQQLRLL